MAKGWLTAWGLALALTAGAGLTDAVIAPVWAQETDADPEPAQAEDPFAASAQTFVTVLLGGSGDQSVWTLRPPTSGAIEPILGDNAMSPFVLRRVRAGLSEQQADIAVAAYPTYAARDFAAEAARASGWSAQVEQVRRSRFRREAVVRIGAAGPSGERLELDWRVGESEGDLVLLDLYVNGASRLSAHQIAVETAFDEGGGVGVVMELDAGP